MADNLQLKLVLKAFDGMSSVIKSACRQSEQEFEKMNKKLEMTAGKFNDVGKKMAGFGAVLSGASAVNLKIAGDFEQGMNNISTLIDTNKENLKLMGKEVLNIAKGSPKAIGDLTEGLYSIRSAGISAEDQFKVLKGSEMLAVAGLASTSEAVDVATSAINAFNLKGEEQNKIYDTLFKVVKYGKTNISEFAQGFGSVAGVVASSGVKLDEYSAAVAAMTTTGLKANNAHTQMSAALASLTRSSKEQTVIFNKLGAKSFKDLVAKSGGMVNAFNRINKAVGGNEAKMVALMGSINGYKAVMGLTNTVNKSYVETLNDMRNGGNALGEAYEKQAGGLNNQMAILKNKFQTLSIEFGQGLLPVVKTAGKAIGGVVEVIGKMPDGLKSFISIATAGVGVTALLGGTGLMAIGGMINGLVQLRKAMVAINIFMWANPAITPILGITAGIAALAPGAVYCYNKFEGFRNVCQGLWAVIKAGGAWLAALWQSFLDGASAFGEWLNEFEPIRKAIEWLKKTGGGFAQWFKDTGDTMTIWAENRQEKAERANAEAKRNREIRRKTAGNKASQAMSDNVKVDGSHAQGLDYVPFNGYIAELHQGERVQTRKEADLFRSGNFSTVNNSNPIEITVEYKPVINIQGSMNESERADFLKLLKSHKDEIVRLVTSTLARQEARSYAW